MLRHLTLFFSFLIFVPSAFAETPCLFSTKAGQIGASPSREQVPAEYRARARCESGVISGYSAEIQGSCFYPTKRGVLERVTTLRSVPPDSQPFIRCFMQSVSSMPAASFGTDTLAAPQDISLEGTIRREIITSPLGSIALRWPRKIESLFGRTPLKATADSARTVSRVLRSPGFPVEVQSLRLDWNIVFMDENLPETQIPSYLVSNCHPAWMTPPANIYVVAQRVSAGCGGARGIPGQVADQELGAVLLHEFGHVVEHHLLNAKIPRDRMRAEGFASWFEQFAAEKSAVVSAANVQQRYEEMARQSLLEKPNFLSFQGTGPDYARASMFFRVIVQRRGVSGLMDVYKTMNEEHLPFLAAVEKRMQLDEVSLDAEVRKALKR